MKVSIELSPSTFESLVQCQIILEAKYHRSISSDELIELMLLRLNHKLNANEESEQQPRPKYQARRFHENRTKRAGGNLNTIPRILSGIRPESQN